MKKEPMEDYLVPLTLLLHLSNIVVIFILLIFFFKALGMGGPFEYVFTFIVFAVFTHREFQHLLSLHAKKGDVQKFLKAEFSVENLKKIVNKGI